MANNWFCSAVYVILGSKSSSSERGPNIVNIVKPCIFQEIFIQSKT